MADTIAESARKASAGSWRKPRMKIYDYNQEFGGNYYQPMIKYINTKGLQGIFHERREVYMPERAEVTSDKYTNMRYNDKTSTGLDLDRFLVDAYSKQIKELNSSTAGAHYLIQHNSKANSCFSDKYLLGHHVMPAQASKKYCRDLTVYHRRDLDQADRDAREAVLRAEIDRLRAEEYQLMLARESGILTPEQKEQINDVRCRLYWIYRVPKGDLKQYKQWLE